MFTNVLKNTVNIRKNILFQRHKHSMWHYCIPKTHHCRNMQNFLWVLNPSQEPLDFVITVLIKHMLSTLYVRIQGLIAQFWNLSQLSWRGHNRIRTTWLVSPHLRMDRTKLPQKTRPRHRAVAATVAGSTSTHWKGTRKGWRQAPHRCQACSMTAAPSVIPQPPPPPPPLKPKAGRGDVKDGSTTTYFDWFSPVAAGVDSSGRDIFTKWFSSMGGPQCKFLHDP
jgi:hypothetical protein